MNDDREPLSPDIQSLLDAARALHPAPAASRDAVRARLDASLRAPLPDPAPALAPPRRWPLTIATFVVGALSGALAQRAFTPRPAVVTVVRVVQAPPAPAARTVADAAVAPVAPALAPPAAAVAADAPTRARVAREPAEDSLNGERAVLEIARTGLTRGQSTAAIAALERHARRYPRGRLAPERDSMWVQALVSAGRYDAAQEHAARFRRSYPGSMLQPVVDEALRQIP